MWHILYTYDYDHDIPRPYRFGLAVPAWQAVTRQCLCATHSCQECDLQLPGSLSGSSATAGSKLQFHFDKKGTSSKNSRAKIQRDSEKGDFQPLLSHVTLRGLPASCSSIPPAVANC